MTQCVGHPRSWVLACARRKKVQASEATMCCAHNLAEIGVDPIVWRRNGRYIDDITRHMKVSLATLRVLPHACVLNVCRLLIGHRSYDSLAGAGRCSVKLSGFASRPEKARTEAAGASGQVCKPPGVCCSCTSWKSRAALTRALVTAQLAASYELDASVHAAAAGALAGS